MGGAQSGEGGDKIDPAIVAYLLGVIFGVLTFREKPQLVPEPLDDGAAHKDAALQGVAGPAGGGGGNGGHKAVFALHRGIAGVHQQETAGAVGVFGLTGGKAGLAEEGGLLVAGHTGDGDLVALNVGVAVNLAGGEDSRQDGLRDVQRIQKGIVPAKGMDVVEHGAGGVGGVGGVDGAAGELPEKPGVHCAEEKLPPPGFVPGTLHMVQKPFDLGGGEVGVGKEAGGFFDVVGKALRDQVVHDIRRAAALPDDGVVDGPAGGLVPEDGGLPLVGDADSGDVPRGYAGFGDDLHHHGVLGGPDLHGVLLHPALLGVELGKLLLAGAYDVLRLVKQNGPGAGGALIQSQKIPAHGDASLCPFGKGKIFFIVPWYGRFDHPQNGNHRPA